MYGRKKLLEVMACKILELAKRQDQKPVASSYAIEADRPKIGRLSQFTRRPFE